MGSGKNIHVVSKLAHFCFSLQVINPFTKYPFHSEFSNMKNHVVEVILSLSAVIFLFP